MKAFTALLFFAVFSFAGTVAVHDPSIVVVYKDAAGNSYPENDAQLSRTKYYYVFGTQNGAAYSTDMLNWTSFTPTYSVGGVVSADYYKVFKEAATWSKWSNSDDLLGNMWAPDILWNKKMQKWCLYYSINGDDWMSSIVLLTSVKIEGPYEYAGTVVWGGMDGNSSGAGNDDYLKVTGSSSIDSRYYMANNGSTNMGKWDGGYGVSAIDPNVFYDEDGVLWMLYGSWSGGLFMLKLDESTGLRDYSKTYTTTWKGTAFKSALQSDQYMGIHVGGGYYVSGEGSYIQYFKDNDGNGYYYLFVSYGFYSPEGGYVMRVFRSKSVTGPYVDVDGDEAIYSSYVFNYGSNTKYGFPIMQNYKWSFWDDGYGEVANGHNSLLKDTDGSMYLIYHRKMDNGTAWHNVETHRLVFNKKGWILAAPFEYRVSYGLSQTEVSKEKLTGAYKIILHEPTDYENLEVNEEKDLLLNADGSVSGAFSGTWNYDFSKGKNYLTLLLSGAMYEGVLLSQLENDKSAHTYTFTAMNADGSRALWGYRVPKTEVLDETLYYGHENVIGDTSYKIAWNDYEKFQKISVAGDFIVEFDFKNYTEALENWNNWVLVFKNESDMWYLRADSYSLETFSGSSVSYQGTWSDWNAFKELFKNAGVKLRTVKESGVINVYASVNDSIVYGVTAFDVPDGNYEVYLGADGAYLDVQRIAFGKLANRDFTGTFDGGVYNAPFNAYQSNVYSASGDFNIDLNFMNYGNGASANFYDNFILKISSDKTTSLLRADAFAMDYSGTFSFEYDWDWNEYNAIMRNAYIEMNISRTHDTIVYKSLITRENGDVYHYKAINAGATTDDVNISLTCEKSGVDLMRVALNSTVGTPDTVVTDSSLETSSIIETQSLIVKGAYMRENVLCVSLEKGGLYRVLVFDMAGHLLKTKDVSLKNGKNEVPLDITPKARYAVRVSKL